MTPSTNALNVYRSLNNAGEGFAPSDDEHASVNEVGADLDATLIERAYTTSDVAVYRHADGSYTLVGDANGPWAVTVPAGGLD